MRIIKYSLACEVAQNATSTLFSFTKQSNSVGAVSPSLFLVLSSSHVAFFPCLNFLEAFLGS